jgi:squalene synthase HpnC
MVEDFLRLLADLPETPPTRDAAICACEKLARTHYENFTVVSWLAPRSMRTHLAVLYAYCRTVDDIGDEATGHRLDLLDVMERELLAAYRGAARHPVLVALQHTIEQHDLPCEPFLRLIEANRVDQCRIRYRTFEELLSYCTLSAHPVGQLVLGLHGLCDREVVALSDTLCTALQLTNFWQDVKRDFKKGRIYLPLDEMASFGVRESDLAADRASPEFMRLMAFQVERARCTFAEGLPLVDRVSGHLKLDIVLFARGGLAVLDKIEALGFDTLHQRPTLRAREKVSLAVSSLISRRWERWT